MKVFVSWSKPLSHEIAKAFAEWLPLVIQECRNPYVSSDTAKGDSWFSAITEELKASEVGVVFITADNVREEWIHLEAGAMYASLGKRLCPVLVSIAKTDYDGPLKNLQVTNALDGEDMLKLVKTINNALDEPLPESQLKASFDAWWPRLKSQIEAAISASSTGAAAPQRTQEEKIDEILLAVRDLQKASAVAPHLAAAFTVATATASSKKLEALTRARNEAANEAARQASAETMESFVKHFGGKYVTGENYESGEVIHINTAPGKSEGKDAIGVIIRWQSGAEQYYDPRTLTFEEVEF